jgi:allantoinase
MTSPRTDHDRYPYSAIVDRPPLNLPGGARLAFWIAPNYEFYELAPPVRPSRRAWPRGDFDVRAYSLRDYGNRVGIWRLFDLLDRLEFRASVSLNVALLDHHPEIGRACVERDWELFSHGIYNTRYLLDLDEVEERAVIQDVVDTVERHTGRRPVGWLSPALTNTRRTLDLIAEYGFLYTCDLFHDDQPTPVRVASGKLISIPYSLEMNDVIVYDFYLQTPDAYGRMIRDQFDQLYAESGGRVMCLPLHPYLIGQPHRIRYLEEALTYIRAHDDVWFTTGAEIARWYIENEYERAATAMGMLTGSQP